MSRPIVLSNGSLNVGINKSGLVHDFYFPYVGLENHSAGQSLRHMVGVWVDGSVHWLTDSDWCIEFSYPQQALVGHVIATNDTIGVALEFDDFVDAEIDAFVRNIVVTNNWDIQRQVRLFMHQAFVIGDGRSNTDTAQYLPDTAALLHYRGRRVFMVSGEHNGKPFDQYTVGLFGIEGHEGTFRDAEDGELSGCNVEHGRVDSVIRFSLDIRPHGSTRTHYWVACGTNTREALEIHHQLSDGGAKGRMDQTVVWWGKWLEPARKASEKLPDELRDGLIRSTLILKSHIDKRGAVIASTDTTMLNYSRDAYGYCWPRDGAYVLWPLIRMGYREEALRFFEFCRRNLHPDGYLMHKYRADGALGSSWHAYVHPSNITAPPIQEDETALVLYMFGQYYSATKDEYSLHDFYRAMVQPMADFLASYIHEPTGLPKPSYDLWEEVFSTMTYTVATVYGALLAAADMAEHVHDDDNAVRWRTAADDICQAAKKHLYNQDRKAFYKSVWLGDESPGYDATIDTSSMFGVYMYGLFPRSSEELKSTVSTIESIFGLNDGSPGLPRYENDYYRRVSDSVTGNYWPICSLWMAQYYISIGDKDKARRIIDWVQSHAESTGIMSEQVSPLDNSSVSVAPLAWSHAEYLSTLLDLAA